MHNGEPVAGGELHRAGEEARWGLCAGGIVRVVQHEQLHAVPCLARHRVEVRQPTQLGARGQRQLLGAEHPGHAMVRRVVRVDERHHITGVEQYGEGRGKPVDGAFDRE